MTINWYDDAKSGPYRVELQRDGSMAHLVTPQTTGTSFAASFPKSLKKGAYSLVVTPINNPQAQSEPFPLRLKGSSVGLLAGVGVAAGGAIAYFLLFNGEADPVPPPPDDDDLPNPPGTPN